MEKKLIGYKAPMDLFDGNIKKNELFTRETKMDNGYYPINEQGEDVFYLPKEIVETWEAVYEESFKEGDYIIWIEDYSAGDSFWFVKGDVVKVEGFGSSSDVLLLNHPKRGIGGFENEGKFRLATPEEIKKSNEPKVGDYLYIIDEGCNITGCKKGDIKKIAKINEAGGIQYSYVYIFEDDTRCSSREKCIRKATAGEIKEYNSITIGGYEMEILDSGKGVAFGCQNFSKEELEEIRNLLSRPIHPVLVIERKTITISLIDKILSKLK